MDNTIGSLSTISLIAFFISTSKAKKSYRKAVDSYNTKLFNDKGTSHKAIPQLQINQHGIGIGLQF